MSDIKHGSKDDYCRQNERMDFFKESLIRIENKIDILFSKYDLVNERQIRTDERVKLLERFVFGAFLTGLVSIAVSLIARFIK